MGLQPHLKPPLFRPILHLAIRTIAETHGTHLKLKNRVFNIFIIFHKIICYYSKSAHNHFAVVANFIVIRTRRSHASQIDHLEHPLEYNLLQKKIRLYEMQYHNDEDESLNDGKRDDAVHQLFIWVRVTTCELIYVYYDSDYDDNDKDSYCYYVLVTTIATNSSHKNLTIIFASLCEMHVELTFAPSASDSGKVHFLMLSQAASNDSPNIQQKTALMVSCVTFTRTHESIIALIANAATFHFFGLVIEVYLGLLHVQLAQLLRFSAPSTHL